MTNKNTQLLCAVLRDFSEEWNLDIDDLDKEYLVGLASDYTFLALTLPKLDDILLSGLSSGTLPLSSHFQYRDGVPKILPGLWHRIFDRGTLRPQPCVESIFALRQISRLFKKVFEVCADEYVDSALAEFVDIDRELPDYTVDPLHCTVSSLIHGKFLRTIGRKEIFSFRHGPGATAERCDSIERWDFPSVSPEIASRFDMSDFFVNYYEDWPVPVVPQKGRVAAVPKTFDKPRLISIEPVSAMYTQQGVLRELDSHMAGFHQLNMRDQTLNENLARRASVDGSLATIDLSAASDRVSLDLVRGIFRYVPSFRDLILDVRTPTVTLPSGETILLRKYASMGCALTFPIQMLVFHTLIITGICRQDNDFSARNVAKWSKSEDIGLFGDDIIVPTVYSQSVIKELQSVGLAVNASKSFTTGLFRESCGGDFYGGIRVNPVYLRRRLPRNRHDVDSLQSVAATSILMMDRGLHHTAIHLSDVVQEILGPCPSGTGIAVAYPWSAKERFNPLLQRHEVWSPVAVPVKEHSRGSDQARLAFALKAVDSSPVIDPFRLEYHGRPTRAFITRRWVPST